MGIRVLLRNSAVLLVVALALAAVTSVRSSAARRARVDTSTFVPLVSGPQVEVGDIAQLQVEIPKNGIRWTYERRDGAWRMPDLLGAFALNDEVESVVRTVINSRMRPVGDLEGSRERFGLSQQSIVTLSLARAVGERVLRVNIGALAPGALKDEVYVVRDGDDTAYLLNSNPISFLMGAKPPPLLDRHVLPRALPHGIPLRISYGGSRATELQELKIKALPQDSQMLDPRFEKTPEQKKPTHEFMGKTPQGETRAFDGNVGMRYVNTLLNLEFDKIVGSIAPSQLSDPRFNNPLFELTMHYEDGKETTLVVTDTLIEGKYPILNKATGQVFIIAPEKLDQLSPQITPKTADSKAASK